MTITLRKLSLKKNEGQKSLSYFTLPCLQCPICFLFYIKMQMDRQL